jgi:excisionase family DNA binding protein
MKKDRPIILDKDYLTRAEAQLYMGLSERALDSIVRRYEIPSSRPPGGKVLFRRADLQSLNEKFFSQPPSN